MLTTPGHGTGSRDSRHQADRLLDRQAGVCPLPRHYRRYRWAITSSLGGPVATVYAVDARGFDWSGEARWAPSTKHARWAIDYAYNNHVRGDHLAADERNSYTPTSLGNNHTIYVTPFVNAEDRATSACVR